MLSPRDAVKAFKALGAVEVPGRGKGDHCWMQIVEDGRQVAIFNVPMKRNPIPLRTLHEGILRPNGIRDAEQLAQLLKARHPAAAYRALRQQSSE